MAERDRRFLSRRNWFCFPKRIAELDGEFRKKRTPSDGRPRVRISFPPAESPSLSRSCFRGSGTPALCAAGLATGSAETCRVLQDRANRRQYLCRAIFQYRSAADGGRANATPVPINWGRSPSSIVRWISVL